MNIRLHDSDTAIPDKDAGLIIWHIGTRLVGAMLGLALAYFLLQFPFDFSQDLEEARALGIVSLTVLTGYPARQDLVIYLAVLGLPILCGGLLWILAHYRFGKYTAPPVTAYVDDVRDRRRWRCWAGICATVVMLTAFDINMLLHTFHNPVVGGWVLLGEEGASLAWAHSILQGGVYGKDFFCLYGPLLVYPLAWLMQLCGDHILVERILKIILDIAGYGILMAAMYRSLRHRGIFIVGTLLLPLVFPATITVSVNSTFLRSTIGF